MGFIKYTRTDIHTIATVLSDIIHFSSDDSFTKKKIVDLFCLKETCNDETISPESLNKKLHEILGSGLELLPGAIYKPGIYAEECLNIEYLKNLSK